MTSLHPYFQPDFRDSHADEPTPDHDRFCADCESKEVTVAVDDGAKGTLYFCKDHSSWLFVSDWAKRYIPAMTNDQRFQIIITPIQ